MRAVTIFTVMLAVTVMVAGVQAATIHVPDDQQTIQAGIDAASDGDTVLVVAGTYYENINFSGKNILVIGDPATPENVIIDGTGQGTVVIIEDNDGDDVVLAGFTIVNGEGEPYAYLGHDLVSGGGILIKNSSPSLKKLIISNCHSSQVGGGLAVLAPSNTLIDSVIFRDNTTEGNGGGMFMHGEQASVSLKYSEFRRNAASGGGAILGNLGTVEIRNTLFQSNHADWAGAIWADYNPVSLNNCCFEGNTSSGGNPGGISAIWARFTRITISECSFTRNVAEGQGATVIASGASDVFVSNCIIWDNANPPFNNMEGRAPVATYSDIQGGYEGEGNISSDPLFLDPDNGNFNIHRGSPCLNAGDPDSPNDPDGTRADMGAFPYDYQGPITLHVPDEYASIQVGIDDAIEGDTVLVETGSYSENLHFLGRNISLIGDPEHPENVIIDANNDGSRVVLFTSGENASCVLSGFTIQNGIADDDNENGGGGGGTYCFLASPTLCNLIVRDNYAMNGGGMGFNGSSSNIHDVLIENNRANSTGGGVNFSNSSLSLENITLVGNASNSGGGAIVYNSDVVISEAIVWGNNPNEIEFYYLDERSVVNLSYSDVSGGENDIANRGGDHILNWGEGNIDSDPLFTDQDNADFHLTLESPCIDAGNPDSPSDPDGTVADMGTYYAHQTFHRIPLRRGWNMLSSFNPARNPAIRTVWSEVVSRNNLVLTKDQTGRFYSAPNNYSNMGPFDVRQGYQAKLAQDDTLIIVNIPMPVDTPIPLHQGWNMAAYFPEQDLTAQIAFANIADHVEMIKDEEGRFFRPAIGFSNMGRLTRGKGYQIKVSQDVELVYNVDQGRMAEASLPNEASLTHFVVSSTDHNMSVLISSTIPLQGELAVFTAGGRCVGAVSVSGTPPYGLAVWGDDASTEVIDGAVAGEALTFRIWDGTAEYAADAKFTEGNGNYTSDGFAQDIITGLVSHPTEWSLSEPYPNPFNPSTTIKFALPGDSKVWLTVYDLAGREVATLVNSELKAGAHSATWNAEGFTSGIYLVKMETPSFGATKKVTLIR